MVIKAEVRHTNPTCERLLKYLPVLILLFIVSACTVPPYGHWGRYDYWRDHCPNFPTCEEAEQVIKENEKLISNLLEENLIYKTFIRKSKRQTGIWRGGC